MGGDRCGGKKGRATVGHVGARRAVAWLQSLAIEGGFPVLTVLHLNPGDTGKSRGHLGSHLNRKSEHVMRITRDGEVCTLKTQWSRKAPIPAGAEPCFKWCDAVHRHVTVKSDATDDKREGYLETLDECFADAPPDGLRRCDLLAAIEKHERISAGGARKQFDGMKAKGLLKKSPAGNYRRTL